MPAWASGITCVYASSTSEQEQMGELAETTGITSRFAVILVTCLQHELILPKLATKMLSSNWLCSTSKVAKIPGYSKVIYSPLYYKA